MLFWKSVDCGDEAQARAYLEVFSIRANADEAFSCIKSSVATLDSVQPKLNSDDQLPASVEDKLSTCYLVFERN